MNKISRLALLLIDAQFKNFLQWAGEALLEYWCKLWQIDNGLAADQVLEFNKFSRCVLCHKNVQLPKDKSWSKKVGVHFQSKF